MNVLPQFLSAQVSVHPPSTLANATFSPQAPLVLNPGTPLSPQSKRDDQLLKASLSSLIQASNVLETRNPVYREETPTKPRTTLLSSGFSPARNLRATLKPHLPEEGSVNWREGSVVVALAEDRGSQPCETPVLGHLAPSSVLCGHCMYMVGRYTGRQNTIHIKTNLARWSYFNHNTQEAGKSL